MPRSDISGRGTEMPSKGTTVMPTMQLLQEQGFDAEQTIRLSAAFDAAWEALKIQQPDLKAGPLTAVAREVLAKFMIEEVQRGTLNEADLVERSLIRFAEAIGPLVPY